MYNYKLQELKSILVSTQSFIDNEALDAYCSLILNSRCLQHERGKTQRHHIIPRAYFKYIGKQCDHSDRNCVILKYRDHVLAHKYLMYCTTGKLSVAMGSAFTFIIGNQSCANNLDDLCIDFETDILQEDYEKAYQLSRDRFAARTDTEKTAFKAKFKGQHKGFIWIHSDDLGVEHFIDPQYIDKFPGFKKGRFPHSDAAKVKMSQSHKTSEKSKRAREKALITKMKNFEKKRQNGDILLIKKHTEKILCVDLNLEFSSIKEAKYWLGRGDIEACCRHRQKKAGNHFWAFANDAEWIEKLKVEIDKCNKKKNLQMQRKNKPGLRIKCLEADMEFSSVTAGKRWLVEQNKCGDIYHALVDPEATAGGYHWIKVS